MSQITSTRGEKKNLYNYTRKRIHLAPAKQNKKTPNNP